MQLQRRFKFATMTVLHAKFSFEIKRLQLKASDQA